MSTYKFAKTHGGPITKDKAKTWMKRFRDKHPSKDAVVARFIGSDIISTILQQDGCVGLRVYFGYGDKDDLEIFFVGAREDGSDMWPEEGVGKDGGRHTLADSTMPCPPYCAANS